METGLRAAIYTRLSRDRTGDQTATLRQEADCRSMASARGWEVAEVYSDVDLSAFQRRKPRPGWEALLADLAAGRFGVIITWKLDRLLRRPRDFERLWEVAEGAGAHIVSVQDGIDTSTPFAGLLVPRILSIVAEMESQSLSVRERSKHEERAKAGRPSGGGYRPFGLTADWSQLVADEAELVRDAARRIVAGESSMYAIAGEWNAVGMATPTGKAWSTQLVRSMLLSPRLAGIRDHGGARYATGAIPAILDPTTHERLEAAIRRRGWRGNEGARFLLSGMVRCATCGATLVIRRRHKDKVRFYGCEKAPGKTACGGVHVIAEPLEQLVGEAVLYRLEHSADALAAALEQRERHDTATADVEQLRADESALEELARDFYAEHRIGRAEYLAARDALEARLEAARGRLVRQDGSGALSAALSGPERARERWEAAGLDWQRHLVAALVDHIEVRPVGRGGNRRNIDPLATVGARSQILWRY